MFKYSFRGEQAAKYKIYSLCSRLKKTKGGEATSNYGFESSGFKLQCNVCSWLSEAMR